MLVHCFSIHPEADFVDIVFQDLLFLFLISEVSSKYPSRCSVGALVIMHAGGVIELVVFAEACTSMSTDRIGHLSICVTRCPSVSTVIVCAVFALTTHTSVFLLLFIAGTGTVRLLNLDIWTVTWLAYRP